ncbi:hypothetical protein ACLB2K_061538 [Fragaria x ananassa]
MALAVSHALLCPKLQFPQRNFRPKAPPLSFSPPNFRAIPQNRRIVLAAASAAGSSNSDSCLNPYEILGMNPIEGFDKVKETYKRKHKEAMSNGDEESAATVCFVSLSLSLFEPSNLIGEVDYAKRDTYKKIINAKIKVVGGDFYVDSCATLEDLRGDLRKEGRLPLPPQFSFWTLHEWRIKVTVLGEKEYVEIVVDLSSTMADLKRIMSQTQLGSHIEDCG